MARMSRRTLEDWMAVLAPPLYRGMAALTWSVIST
jgi:hypothetical protein